MIATCFVYVVLFAGMAFVLGVGGALGVYWLQGESAARSFVHSYFVTFNAIGVAGTGYALMTFVRVTGKNVVAQLGNILDVPEEHAVGFARHLHRTISWRWANAISIPLTITGSVVLWWRGFPLSGFGKIYLALCSFSIYYVASNILSYYMYVILLFRYVEEHGTTRTETRFRLKVSPGSMEIQTIDLFLVTSATMGIITLYIGLRATLTANFIDQTTFFRELLLLPFILYLPATLCYSLYPRFVLRQIGECDALLSIQEFERQITSAGASDLKSNLELRKLIIDVKEKMLNDCRSVPILGLKDAPSLTMSIIVVLQVLWQKDQVFSSFFSIFK